MANELTFKNLPFVPVEGQVIYVEQSYNERLNKFIRANYEWLRSIFRSQGFEFCYLPLLARKTVSYHAPYLTDEELDNRVAHIPSLADYLVRRRAIKPSLVFALKTPVKDTDGNVVLQAVGIRTNWFRSIKSTFISLVMAVTKVACPQGARCKKNAFRRLAEKEWIRCAKECTKQSDETPSESESFVEEDQPRFSVAPSNANVKFSVRETNRDDYILPPISHGDVRFSFKETHRGDDEFSKPKIKDPEEADKNFDSQSQELIDELKVLIQSLRNRGVNTMILHDIIDQGESLSRLRITHDFRMFLVDYHNKEIKLPILPKAVFFLFLRHPEGIRFKELPDYYSELLEIYQKMNPIGGRMKQEQSIRDITDPCSNSINEKCARIREAFIRNFDDRLAKNYYVTGKRGEAKRIILDKSMVIWD